MIKTLIIIRNIILFALLLLACAWIYAVTFYSTLEKYFEPYHVALATIPAILEIFIRQLENKQEPPSSSSTNNYNIETHNHDGDINIGVQTVNKNK